MKHYQAMGVVMHKLLRIIYGVLKSKKGYDPDVDEKNVLKAAEKQQEQKENTRNFSFVLQVGQKSLTRGYLKTN